ncbi:MAG TPA: S8 family serine peptidase [Geopsychrobacteraceae bacterium]|jgi:subtilisin family serine protease
MKRIALTMFLIMALPLSLIPAAAVALEQESFIVVLDERADAPAAARAIAGQVGGQVGFIYEHALKGFSISVPPRALTALARNPQVKYLATDDVRQVFAQSVPSGISRIFADGNPGIGIDGADDYRVDVDVAVIDTGIDLQHPDLNVVGGVTCSGGSPFKGKCGPGGDDDHYHGTHVAGTIAALDNGIGVVGVAPGARLWAVKVLNANGSGYSSWIVAGLDWVAARADTIEVANMSLGGDGFNRAEYDAIQGCVDKGVAFAVAAGNSDADANDYSPAAFDNVLTVSALADFDGLPGADAEPTCRTDQDDTLADFSNWGSAIDIAAPGVCIRSTYPLERGEYGTISGTSMASPHAAGALALLAGTYNPNNATDVYALYGQVIVNGNDHWLDDSGDGTQESLLDVSDATLFTPVLIAGSGGDPPPANDAPSVSISSPADGDPFDTGESIAFAGSASDPEDGDLSAYLVWTSDVDGFIGEGASISAVLTDGGHTITAAVTDADGAEGSAGITITVGADGESDFNLSVTAYKVRGTRYADLAWNGTSAAQVDVYRDNAKIASVVNGGTYTDGPLGKGGGSATYQVCEAGSLTACSNEVPLRW